MESQTIILNSERLLDTVFKVLTFLILISNFTGFQSRDMHSLHRAAIS